MKSDRSLAIGDAKKIKPVQNQQITPAFFDVLEVILTSIHEPVLLLDAELKVMRANHAFYRTFQVDADKAEGMMFYDLGDRQWDIPRLRELLENILPENSKYDDF
jgi:PAS domain-containing protein